MISILQYKNNLRRNLPYFRITDPHRHSLCFSWIMNYASCIMIRFPNYATWKVIAEGKSLGVVGIETSFVMLTIFFISTQTASIIIVNILGKNLPRTRKDTFDNKEHSVLCFGFNRSFSGSYKGMTRSRFFISILKSFRELEFQLFFLRPRDACGRVEPALNSYFEKSKIFQNKNDWL